MDMGVVGITAFVFPTACTCDVPCPFACTSCLLSVRMTKAEEAKGWRPLHLAAMRGHVSVARTLLDHGALADDSRCRVGWRPLQVACHSTLIPQCDDDLLPSD